MIFKMKKHISDETSWGVPYFCEILYHVAGVCWNFLVPAILPLGAWTDVLIIFASAFLCEARSGRSPK